MTRAGSLPVSPGVAKNPDAIFSVIEAHDQFHFSSLS
jgi:hypothetical protein